MLSVPAMEDLMIQGPLNSDSFIVLLWWYKCINVTIHPGFGSQSGGPKTKTL